MGDERSGGRRRNGERIGSLFTGRQVRTIMRRGVLNGNEIFKRDVRRRLRAGRPRYKTIGSVHSRLENAYETFKRRVHLLFALHRIDISLLRGRRSLTDGALTSDELPKLEHPSSHKSVRTGESSSIKGPISDDKDLEMNGPCHSTGSLSSERAPAAFRTTE